MGPEAALRSSAVADQLEEESGESVAIDRRVNDVIGRDRIPARDLQALKSGTVDEFAGKIMTALDKSIILKMMTRAASTRFAKHVETKDRLGITDPAVGTILQEIFLRVRASLSGEAVAYASDDYLGLYEPLRSTVSATADRAVDVLGAFLSIGHTKERASALNAEFCRVLEANDLRATESLVGAVLQEIWLRVHRSFQA